MRQNIDACAKQVDEIVCVDNGSKNISEIERFLDETQKAPGGRNVGDRGVQASQCHSKNICIRLIKNHENLGIARALNQILLYARDRGYKWTLSLDQDSVILPGLLNDYEQIIAECKRKKETDQEAVASNKLAMLTTIYQDRNSTLKAMTNGEYEEVSECITSASYANVDVLLEVGGYDEKMFIDFVDYDICATLREHGYKIARNNKTELVHEVGKARTVSLFGVKTNVHNESAFRKYYQTRNHLYYIKKHKSSVNKLVEYRRIVKLCILTLLYKDDRWNKLKAMYRGVRDSHEMKKTLNRQEKKVNE